MATWCFGAATKLVANLYFGARQKLVEDFELGAACPISNLVAAAEVGEG